MIIGLEHVGLSVADLDQSVAFYRDILGMRATIVTTFGGPHYEAVLGLANTRGRVALLEHDSGLKLELFEFAHPAPRRSDPERPVSDHGITHFCIAVVDLASMHERLSAAGVRFHCVPQRYSALSSVTYARDPDGNVIELLERDEDAPR